MSPGRCLLLALAACASSLLAAPSNAAPAVPTAPARPTAPVLDRTLQVVRGLFVDTPTGLERHFSARFLRAVPAARMRKHFADYYRQAGKVVAVERIAALGPWNARYRFFGTRGSYPLTLGVESAPPHRIGSFWIGPIVANLASPQAFVAELAKLPGQHSFALWRLAGRRPVVLAAREPERRLAIGSIFKLYILGALIDGLTRGRWSWKQTLVLQERYRSLPSGVLQRWPLGAPVTLATLATQMISISDNTATDHLLAFVGRRRVEALLPRMGHGRDPRNQPFLSTREMFLLKDRSAAGRARLARYLSASEAARRAYLTTDLSKISDRSATGISRDVPTAIDRLEWFASAAELCRAMDWLRRATERGPAKLGRALLGVNKGVTFRTDRWRYVGYKGGSEPGVLSLAWLLQDQAGRWLALSVGWNEPRHPLAEGKLLGLVQSLIVHLERR